MVPLAAVFFVLASTLTIVFWTKWLGRLLQVLPKLRWPMEKLSSSYAVPLWTLLIGIFVVGIGIGPIYQNFLLAATNNIVSGNQILSLGLNNLVLTSPSILQKEILGVFPVWPLYLILFVALLLPLLLIGLKPTELRQVYMCGEQVGGTDTDEWLAEADKKTKFVLGGYYFQDVLGEKRVYPWANAIAILLLAIMIGCGVVVI
jgi:ech hydrogenase subunit A